MGQGDKTLLCHKGKGRGRGKGRDRKKTDITLP